MNIIGKKKIVIAGDSLEEVKADLASLEALMRSGMTSGCGGQTGLAAQEGHAAMLEAKGWAPAVAVVAITPQMLTTPPKEEDWDEDEEEDWEEVEEEDWEEDFRCDFGNEAEEMVDMVLDIVRDLRNPKILASDLICCATDLLRAAVEYSSDEIDRAKMVERMLSSAETLRVDFAFAN